MINQAKSRVSRKNLDPDTLQELQECVFRWQNYNFGEQVNEYALMGVCEEAGELCHAQLKLEQNIRGSVEKHEEEMLDAVGDIMIYLMNYMSGKKWKINPFTELNTEKTDNQKAVRESVFSVFRLIGKLLENPDVEDRAHQVSRQINFLCALKGWDTEQVIRDTWKKVGQRDWKKYPQTGLPPEA